MMTSDLEASVFQVEQCFDYTFKDKDLVSSALTHKSYFNENRPEDSEKQSGIQHNERLEFLGDAVLELCLSDLLIKHFPDSDEGFLSKLRASLVNETSLNKLAKQLELQDSIRLGKGEWLSGGADKPRILSSLFEALLGAIYLDGEFEAAKKTVSHIFLPMLKDMEQIEEFYSDYKTQLQELAQKLYGITPEYKLMESSGPDHEKSFIMEVFVNDQVKAQGEGSSKKQAAQRAAQILLKEIEDESI